MTQTQTRTQNQLLEFRTMFVRAVAEAWADPVWGAALTAKGGARSLAVLNERFSDYHWPWKGVWDLRVVESGSRWVDHEWIWPSTLPESLTLFLPLFPSEANGIGSPAKRARALADYYQQRPLLFADTLPLLYSPRGPAVSEAAAEGFGLDHGLMPSDRDFTEFKIALVAAVARAWADPAYLDVLTTNATIALNRIPHYKVPWDLAVRVQHDDKISWSETAGWSWDCMTPNILMLYLPPAPTEMNSQPLALAMYNAAGAKYPFTCCPC